MVANTEIKAGNVPEKSIEKYLRTEVEKRGGIALKFASQTETGYPDRLCVLPGNRVFWVELKRRGGKPRRLQEVRISQLREMGCHVHVADSFEAVDELMREEEA